MHLELATSTEVSLGMTCTLRLVRRRRDHVARRVEVDLCQVVRGKWERILRAVPPMQRLCLVHEIEVVLLELEVLLVDGCLLRILALRRLALVVRGWTLHYRAMAHVRDEVVVHAELIDMRPPERLLRGVVALESESVGHVLALVHEVVALDAPRVHRLVQNLLHIHRSAHCVLLVLVC